MSVDKLSELYDKVDQIDDNIEIQDDLRDITDDYQSENIKGTVNTWFSTIKMMILSDTDYTEDIKTLIIKLSEIISSDDKLDENINYIYNKNTEVSKNEYNLLDMDEETIHDITSNL